MKSTTVMVSGSVIGLIVVLLLAKSAWSSKVQAFKLQQELIATQAQITNKFPDNLSFNVAFHHQNWQIDGLMPVKNESNRVIFNSRRGDEIVFTMISVITNLSGTNSVITGTNETITATNTAAQ